MPRLAVEGDLKEPVNGNAVLLAKSRAVRKNPGSQTEHNQPKARTGLDIIQDPLEIALLA